MITLPKSEVHIYSDYQSKKSRKSSTSTASYLDWILKRVLEALSAHYTGLREDYGDLEWYRVVKQGFYYLTLPVVFAVIILVLLC